MLSCLSLSQKNTDLTMIVSMRFESGYGTRSGNILPKIGNVLPTGWQLLAKHG